MASMQYQKPLTMRQMPRDLAHVPGANNGINAIPETFNGAANPHDLVHIPGANNGISAIPETFNSAPNAP
ncbi:hypothetical protein PoB_007404500 [Plakobranchus ocellatus]|uniref:Uncharacterized protein n=1 Tax=Plakobranchus ocellatus TaxID=259542 RepID=A0AAV4DU99_9GAST|nr:hypothetical protein PoB_007404500 [Plakobranchus ocellatus]